MREILDALEKLSIDSLKKINYFTEFPIELSNFHQALQKQDVVTLTFDAENTISPVEILVVQQKLLILKNIYYSSSKTTKDDMEKLIALDVNLYVNLYRRISSARPDLKAVQEHVIEIKYEPSAAKSFLDKVSYFFNLLSQSSVVNIEPVPLSNVHKRKLSDLDSSKKKVKTKKKDKAKKKVKTKKKDKARKKVETRKKATISSDIENTSDIVPTKFSIETQTGYSSSGAINLTSDVIVDSSSNSQSLISEAQDELLSDIINNPLTDEDLNLVLTLHQHLNEKNIDSNYSNSNKSFIDSTPSSPRAMCIESTTSIVSNSLNSEKNPVSSAKARKRKYFTNKDNRQLGRELTTISDVSHRKEPAASPDLLQNPNQSANDSIKEVVLSKEKNVKEKFDELIKINNQNQPPLLKPILNHLPKANSTSSYKHLRPIFQLSKSTPTFISDRKEPASSPDILQKQNYSADVSIKEVFNKEKSVDHVRKEVVLSNEKNVKDTTNIQENTVSNAINKTLNSYKKPSYNHKYARSQWQLNFTTLNDKLVSDKKSSDALQPGSTSSDKHLRPISQPSKPTPTFRDPNLFFEKKDLLNKNIVFTDNSVKEIELELANHPEKINPDKAKKYIENSSDKFNAIANVLKINIPNFALFLAAMNIENQPAICWFLTANNVIDACKIVLHSNLDDKIKVELVSSCITPANSNSLNQMALPQKLLQLLSEAINNKFSNISPNWSKTSK